MTGTEDLISGYLARLEAAAWALPATERTELLSEIRQHITVTLAECGNRDEATVRNVLDHLGDPEVIASEAEWHPPAPVRAQRPLGLPEVITAIALGLAGVLLPVAGWAIGAVIAWTATRWPLRSKLLAMVVWPIGLGAAVLLTRNAGGPVDGWTLIPLLVIAAVIIATILLMRRGRAARIQVGRP